MHTLSLKQITQTLQSLAPIYKEKGKTRGLLCSKCNSGIGYFEDNYIKLLKAIKYLKKYE